MAENPISYDIDADKKFAKTMQKAIASGLDLSFSMGEAARMIKKGQTGNFILKGFGKYSPLSPKYFQWKQKLAPGTPILTGINSAGGASGKLKKSILDNTADSILRIGKNSLEVGTKATSNKGAPYPTYVQEGTTKMPARKFLFLTQRLVKQIINSIEGDIANQLP